jgi:hypothetical protein
MNQGRRFFTKNAPADMKKKDVKKFLEEVEQDKQKYITEWTGD